MIYQSLNKIGLFLGMQNEIQHIKFCVTFFSTTFVDLCRFCSIIVASLAISYFFSGRRRRHHPRDVLDLRDREVTRGLGAILERMEQKVHVVYIHIAKIIPTAKMFNW